MVPNASVPLKKPSENLQKAWRTSAQDPLKNDKEIWLLLKSVIELLFKDI